MQITGITFLGFRTDRPKAVERFFGQVLGLARTREEPGLAGFRLADGTALEVYGPADEFHRFFTTGPVIGFRVADFDQAYTELQEAGIESIGPVQHDVGMSWCHFRAPDGTLLEIAGQAAYLARDGIHCRKEARRVW